MEMMRIVRFIAAVAWAVLIAGGIALSSGEANGQEPIEPDLQLPEQLRGEPEQPRAAFEFEVPSRLGGDAIEDGIFDGARTPFTALQDEAIDLRLRVSEPACDSTAGYEWRLDSKLVEADEVDECRFTIRVPEGAHEISLTVRSGGGESTATEVVNAANHLIVSIGDSVASGEGNPDVGGHLLRQAKWLDQRCHRSMLSGPARAALRIESGEETSRVTFVPLGCSGASIQRGLLGRYSGFEPRGRPKLPPQMDQLDALAARGEVDAVVINIGGNDIGFERIIRFCVRKNRCPGERRDGLPLGDFVDRALKDLGVSLDDLGRRLRVLDAPVVLVEYFDPTQGPNGFCKMLAGRISREESEWAHDEVVGPLNATLRDAAQRYGWSYVDGVDEAFKGRGICAGSEERWIRTPTKSILRQGDLNLENRLAGTLHPNGAGHSAIASLIGPQLAAILGAEFDENPIEPLSGGGLSHLAWFLIIVAGAVLLGTAAVVAYLLLRSRRRAGAR